MKDRAATAPPAIDLAADKGKISHATLQTIPGGLSWRLSFQLDPGSEKVVELRARLLDEGKPISETWVTRWTA